MSDLGAMANELAAAGVFTDYRMRKSAQTLRNHHTAVTAFTTYLQAKGVTVGDLENEPCAWAGITWGLVEGFKRAMVRDGLAIATVNNRLSAIKTYAALAFQAGGLSECEARKISSVKGFSKKEAGRVTDTAERVGEKKAEHTRLTLAQARALKGTAERAFLDTQKRDRLIMLLLLEHGLRVGEVASLTVANVHVETAELVFFRSKVSKWQTHKLTEATAAAVTAYLDIKPKGDNLIMGSRRGGRLVGTMSARAINELIRRAGEAVGVADLSPHDLRHYWATNAAKSGTDLLSLQEAGGWASLAMPRRYVEAAAVANDGVKLTL
jgi:integrase